MPTPVRRKQPTQSVRENPYAKPTKPAVLIDKANAFGNPGLKYSQGSSVIIYDHLPLVEGAIPVGTELKFFENAASRAFPFTNLMEGRLPVSEGFILARMWFTIMTVTTATGAIVDVQTFDDFGVPGLYKADFSFFNANNRVIKPTPLTKMKSAFNWKAWSNVAEVIHLDTDISIQPLIEFTCNVRLPAVVMTASDTLSYYLGCYAEGPGGIMNPRANF